MNKRETYAIVGLAVLFGLAAVWGGFQLKERRVAEAQLVNKYNGAFYESLQRTKNVEALLSKGLASGSSDNMDNLFSDLWYNANTAQANLHQLPVSHQVVAQTSKFLTPVGDYAYAITKRDQGKKLTERDRQTMSELYKKSQDLNRELSRVQRQAAAGSFSWTEVRQGLNRNLSKGQLSGADDSFRRVDSQMQEVPVLIYDGPFSDHLERAKPGGVTGKFGIPMALKMAKALHLAVILLLLMVPYFSAHPHAIPGVFYYLGIAVVAGLLFWEHLIVKPDDLKQVTTAAYTVNQIIGVTLLIFTIIDVFITKV
jgi:germination protein YpeB